MNAILAGTFNATPSQVERLRERHGSKAKEIVCCGLPITVLGGVYQTSTDTELMAESVRITSSESFLEIGCGTGVISLVLGKRGHHGLGVDINKRAVKNSRLNAARHQIKNVIFTESDVFKKVKGRFDVIVCNPPYTDHPASDAIEKMFWDENNAMTQRFFQEVSRFLNKNGRVYFGWADFADIDVRLPFRLAKDNTFALVHTFSKQPSKKNYKFYVLEFQPE